MKIMIKMYILDPQNKKNFALTRDKLSNLAGRWGLTSPDTKEGPNFLGP